MSRTGVDQHVNLRQREVVIWTSFVRSSVINTFVIFHYYSLQELYLQAIQDKTSQVKSPSYNQSIYFYNCQLMI